ncbi:MAG: uroporphyrinogen-III synthase [Flavobacteriales bacterium]|nr:uroporphyrinogen-III synthase [Flavobacteriales bacterium]MBK9195761.1 uroporphyrinogen-III synthase [Flavobacteriales bacterium]
MSVKIDFRPFIKIEPIAGQDFRQDRVNILDHTAVIFTSRNAVDHFFRIAKEVRVLVPEMMKYFCVSESVAYYVQKYIVYRKRKVFIGKQTFGDLMDVIKKHKDEKFLVPCTDIQKQEIPELLDKAGIAYSKAVIYRTVAADLRDLKEVKYDMLVFFSPAGIESLKKNFPDFTQNGTVIAAFGPTTVKAVRDAGLRLDIEAPLPEAPSMTGAIELYMKRAAKGHTGPLAPPPPPPPVIKTATKKPEIGVKKAMKAMVKQVVKAVNQTSKTKAATAKKTAKPAKKK